MEENSAYCVARAAIDHGRDRNVREDAKKKARQKPGLRGLREREDYGYVEAIRGKDPRLDEPTVAGGCLALGAILLIAVPALFHTLHETRPRSRTALGLCARRASI